MKSKNDIKIVEKPAVHVVGLHVRTNMAQAKDDCPKLFQQFAPMMGKVMGDPIGVSYGISCMVPESHDAFEYWAAIPLKSGTPTPAGMQALDIPAGLYAECPFSSIAEISQAFQCLWSEWLPSQQEYEVNFAVPSYEYYPADFMQTGKGSAFMPVKKKA